MNLDDSTQLCRLFADGTRLRLLLLLEDQPLSVAELTRITQLAQSRISTHLGKLRDAGLVQDSRSGTSVLYALNTEHADSSTRELWRALRQHLDEQGLERDRERMREILRMRTQNRSWADSVAGRMKSQYSPGRTWEATTRALLQLLQLGDVLDVASGDGLLAELLSPHARSVACLDLSEAVVRAGQRQLRQRSNVQFHQGDMHALPFKKQQFDTVFLMHALTYTQQPETVLAEIGRVLRPGGQLVLATLKAHDHRATVADYDHVNPGYTAAQLRKLIARAGLSLSEMNTDLRESRPPYFEVITALAQQPA